MARLARSPGIADTASPADSYGFAPGDRYSAPYRYRFASSPGRWPASYRQECAWKRLNSTKSCYYIQVPAIACFRRFQEPKALNLGLVGTDD